MPHSRSARALAALLVCLRLTVVAVIGLVALAVVRGTPVSADPLPLLRRSLAPLALFSGGGHPARDPADALRGDLQALLAHHATLSVRLMRATMSGDPALVDTADAVLVGNTTDLEQTLQPALGGQAAAAFANRWQLRTRMLFRYAAGVRDDSEAVRSEARTQLTAFDQVIATILSDATDGALDEQAITDTLAQQTDRLTAQADAYARGDHTRAFRLQRAIYAKMYPLGGAVAAAATGRSVSDVAPAEHLRTALARLLGEHVELTVETMRAGTTGAAEFDAAANALDDNTADIGAAMHSLLDDAEAEAFATAWADHIDLLMRYTVAVTEQDRQARADVRRALPAVTERLAAVLDDATDAALDTAAVTDAVTHHEQQMLEQIELFAAEDYHGAYDTAYDAFTHIDRVADAIAAALVDVVGRRLPAGGAATGGGGDAWTVQ